MTLLSYFPYILFMSAWPISILCKFHADVVGFAISYFPFKCHASILFSLYLRCNFQKMYSSETVGSARGRYNDLKAESCNLQAALPTIGYFLEARKKISAELFANIDRRRNNCKTGVWWCPICHNEHLSFINPLLASLDFVGSSWYKVCHGNKVCRRL